MTRFLTGGIYYGYKWIPKGMVGHTTRDSFPHKTDVYSKLWMKKEQAFSSWVSKSQCNSLCFLHHSICKAKGIGRGLTQYLIKSKLRGAFKHILSAKNNYFFFLFPFFGISRGSNTWEMPSDNNQFTHEARKAFTIRPWPKKKSNLIRQTTHQIQYIYHDKKNAPSELH